MDRPGYAMNTLNAAFHPIEFVIATIVRFLPDCFVDRGEGELAPTLLRFRVFPNAAVIPYVHFSFTLPNSILLMTQAEIIPLLKGPIEAAKKEFLSLEIGHVIETYSAEEEKQNDMIESAREALVGAAPWVKI